MFQVFDNIEKYLQRSIRLLAVPPLVAQRVSCPMALNCRLKLEMVLKPHSQAYFNFQLPSTLRKT
jgi:hypothetical protein